MYDRSPLDGPNYGSAAKIWRIGRTEGDCPSRASWLDGDRTKAMKVVDSQPKVSGDARLYVAPKRQFNGAYSGCPACGEPLVGRGKYCTEICRIRAARARHSA